MPGWVRSWWYKSVAKALEARFGEPESAKIVWRPQTLVPVAGETAETVLKLVSALDDLDDVQAVYANFDISEEDLARHQG